MVNHITHEIESQKPRVGSCTVVSRTVCEGGNARLAYVPGSATRLIVMSDIALESNGCGRDAACAADRLERSMVPRPHLRAEESHLSVQLVSLEESPLHGALKSIPRKPFELDPEYEVDPSQLVIMEKIGARPTLCLCH